MGSFGVGKCFYLTFLEEEENEYLKKELIYYV
jgi:hypothetical protein